MRELRKRADVTQEAVARATGLSRQFYVGVERGQRILSLDHIFAIADALSVDPREFFTDLSAEDWLVAAAPPLSGPQRDTLALLLRCLAAARCSTAAGSNGRRACSPSA